MTGYEIIKGNINFTNPDRIGLRFDRIAGVGDVYRIFVLPAKSSREAGKPYSVCKKVRPGNGEYDEWGCCWKSKDETGSDMGQVTNVPIQELEDYDKFQGRTHTQKAGLTAWKKLWTRRKRKVFMSNSTVLNASLSGCTSFGGLTIRLWIACWNRKN